MQYTIDNKNIKRRCMKKKKKGGGGDVIGESIVVKLIVTDDWIVGCRSYSVSVQPGRYLGVILMIASLLALMSSVFRLGS
ncbi:unnamed protein product [Onchocerca flexuosa]|uniref:Transmembrane protein n=1 Tax=Onchocerca flexuosa TaxID=387005 RepID=A0A183I361_9BILA|nr:unnamed protein product [Onchocerca flexuosa]